MKHRRRAVLLSLVAAVAALVAALPAASAARPSPAGRAPAIAQPTACAWPIESTPAKANVAYPDSNATYWTTPYIAQTGMTITLSGAFPLARFFSINVYDSSAQDFTRSGVGSSLTDYEIVPDAGTQNPWITADALAGTYTVTLANSPADGAVNTIPLSPQPLAQPLAPGVPAATGFVMMRVYLPAGGDANAMPLPTMTISTAAGTKVRTLAQCARAQSTPTMASSITKKAIAKLLSQSLAGSAGASPAPSGACSESLVFCKAGGATTPFPNSDSGYVAATYQPAAGHVTVVRARMPASATAYGNGPGPWPAAGLDLRYWSFCNYIYAKPFPVVSIGPIMGCAADQDVPLVNGTATVVISSVRDRPASTRGASARLGWLPTSRSNTTAKEVIAIRNMLAAPTFSQSVMSAADSDPASAKATMGRYYPTGTQCTTATFARGGVAGCFARPSSPS